MHGKFRQTSANWQLNSLSVRPVKRQKILPFANRESGSQLSIRSVQFLVRNGNHNGVVAFTFQN